MNSLKQTLGKLRQGLGGRAARVRSGGLEGLITIHLHESLCHPAATGSPSEQEQNQQKDTNTERKNDERMSC